jgi:hypothetical protein
MKHRSFWVLVLGLWFGVLGLIVSCATTNQPFSDYRSPVYQLSPQWVMEKIETCRISEGMTIEQCRLSWAGSDSYFQKVRSDSRGYELWRVENAGRVLYLHVQNGVVTLISEYRR